jgi:acetolactate synthase-1/2/3 large subunit
MIRVADYIAQTLAERGIRHVFMVTGGGAMHLNDALSRNRDLAVVCCHHEQTCAMAAESYFRLTNRVAAVNVTTGPGGTNAITGVYGAHVDSMAMVVVSGQVKWETCARSTPLPLRQLGDQEVDIVRMVEPITKYAVVIQDPASIRYHLERALHLATHGRPAPSGSTCQSTSRPPRSIPPPCAAMIQRRTPSIGRHPTSTPPPAKS